MKIFRTFKDAANIRNPAVTTGSFDGVHIGHKTILDRLKMMARKYDGESVLITFEPHPRKVLYPDTSGKYLRFITSREEKLELLRKAGLDNVIIIEFTREFSKITSEQFIRDFLHGILKVKVVVAGFNHHFGFNQEGDYRQLWNLREKYNFEAEEIPEQEVQNETVSSTKIREAIKEGFIQRANAYLDHYYILMGRPVEYHYYNPGFPVPLVRIPLTDESKLLPAQGVYAVSVESGSRNSKGMVIISMNQKEETEVLLRLFESDSPPTGELSTLFFHKRVHGSIDMGSYSASAIRLKAAENEILELIY